MSDIHIYTTLKSDTPHLPELRPLVGRAVEIIVREDVPAEDIRTAFYAELGRFPESPDAFATQVQTFKAWRDDPRFRAYWPTLDHVLARDFDAVREQAGRFRALEEAVRAIQEEGGIDEEAIRAQDACDWLHASEPPR